MPGRRNPKDFRHYTPIMHEKNTPYGPEFQEIRLFFPRNNRFIGYFDRKIAISEQNCRCIGLEFRLKRCIFSRNCAKNSQISQKYAQFWAYFSNFMAIIDKNRRFLSMVARQKCFEIERFRRKIGHLEQNIAQIEQNMHLFGPIIHNLANKSMIYHRFGL